MTGGAITGNNLVWRQVTFTALTTPKIRIMVNGALNTWSRITEVEAWTGSGVTNQPPTATLTGPPNNSTYSAPATVPLTATASDPDSGDTIDHVQFFANGSPVGASTTPVAGVYSFNWPNVVAGNYTLTAQSFDNHGLPSTLSNAAQISVTGGGGSAAATFVSTDTSTHGNWRGIYGGDGYSIVGDSASLPSYASMSAIGAQTYIWASGTSDTRALQLAESPSQRIAATWYATTFDLDVNLTGGSHQVALYSVDWDTTSRAQRIDVLDAVTGTVLDTRNVTNFSGGQYLVWNVTGHVKFRVTQTGAFNGVVSAIFFGAANAANQPPTAALTGPTDGSTYTVPATIGLTATASDPDAGDTIDHVAFFANGTSLGTSTTPVAGVYNFTWTSVPAGSYTLTAQSFDNHGTPSAVSNARQVVVNGGVGGNTATFVTTDTTTQGNWSGVYGGDGYSIVSDVTSLPAYATVQPSVGALQFTWAASTSDTRALTRVGGGRVAATWYQSTFDLDVAISTGTHQVALYCVDWDTTTRGERIDVLDAVTNALLDTRTVNSFSNGQYLVWNVTGHVKFRVTQTGSFNAVVSAIFFGAPHAPVPLPAADPSRSEKGK